MKIRDLIFIEQRISDRIRFSSVAVSPVTKINRAKRLLAPPDWWFPQEITEDDEDDEDYEDDED